MSEPESDWLSIDCPAKLNVFLEVRSRRSDGYHELESVMLRTSLCDRMRIRTVADGEIRLSISTSGPESAEVPTDDRNLIVRAARALQSDSGCAAGCEVILEKRIPSESGLAGGSSNAAMTLRALNSLWNLGFDDPRLHDIAARLGSDVNFLLSGARAAVCRGRGERVEPIDLPRRLFFVATRPQQGNRTPVVFRHTQIPAHPKSPQTTLDWLRDPDVPIHAACFNRLTEAARDINPAMADLMDRLQAELQQPVLMSGSGSTVFLVAEDADHAAKLQQQVTAIANRPTWLLEC